MAISCLFIIPSLRSFISCFGGVLFSCEHSLRQPSLSPALPLQSHFLSLSLSLLVLEQVDLNAEPQLSQSLASCRPPIRSRPFAFSSLDEGKKRNLLSRLMESAGSCPALWLYPPHHQTDNGRVDRNKGD